MFQYDQGTGSERFSVLPQFVLEVGGVTGSRLKIDLSKGGIYVYSWVRDVLDSLQKPERQEQVSIVKFRLRDVGIRQYVSGMEGWKTLVRTVEKEGLDLLPQLTAPEIALHKPEIIGEGEYVDILSKPFTHGPGYQRVFVLRRYGGGLELNGRWIDNGWHPDRLAVARLRKC